MFAWTNRKKFRQPYHQGKIANCSKVFRSKSRKARNKKLKKFIFPQYVPLDTWNAVWWPCRYFSDKRLKVLLQILKQFGKVDWQKMFFSKFSSIHVDCSSDNPAENFRGTNQPFFTPSPRAKKTFTKKFNLKLSFWKRQVQCSLTSLPLIFDKRSKNFHTNSKNNWNKNYQILYFPWNCLSGHLECIYENSFEIF